MAQHTVIFLLLVTCIQQIGCSKSGVEKAILKMFEKDVDKWDTADPETFMTMFTDDVIFSYAGHPMGQGKENLQPILTEMLNGYLVGRLKEVDGRKDVQFHHLDNDFVVTIATIEMINSAGNITSSVSDMIVWQKDGGEWLQRIDVINNVTNSQEF